MILTEETPWIGGQLTNQAVPPDEHPWIEEFGATASYRLLRYSIREFYRNNLPLTSAARVATALNPGNGWVSPLCHDPRVAVAVLTQVLTQYQIGGNLFVMQPQRPIAAWTHADRVTGVVVRGLETGRDTLIEAPFFIDATPLGELLEMAGVEHVLGAESHTETGEPHAPPEADPLDQQAFTVCFAMEYHPGEDHTIDKPRQYGLWRDFTPPNWTGRLLGWTTQRPETHEPLTRFLFEAEDGLPWWRFRRILDRTNFEAGFVESDVTVVNWPQNDYWFGPICGVDEAEAARNLEAARQLSLSLLYWLQTEAPRPEGGSDTADFIFGGTWSGQLPTASRRPLTSGRRDGSERSLPSRSSTSRTRYGRTDRKSFPTLLASAATASICIPGSTARATWICDAGPSRFLSVR